MLLSIYPYVNLVHALVTQIHIFYFNHSERASTCKTILTGPAPVPNYLNQGFWVMPFQEIVHLQCSMILCTCATHHTHAPCSYGSCTLHPLVCAECIYTQYGASRSRAVRVQLSCSTSYQFSFAIEKEEKHTLLTMTCVKIIRIPAYIWNMMLAQPIIVLEHSYVMHYNITDRTYRCRPCSDLAEMVLVEDFLKGPT